MRADYIDPEVYGKVFHLLQYENALALRTSLETGLRISDVLSIRTSDIRGNRLTFTAQKTGKEGTKILSGDLLRRLRRISGKEFIFEGRSGTKPRTRQAVWKDLKKAAEFLGVDQNLSCHSARKTYSVELFHEKGIGAVQKELQHSRLDNTMLYAFSDIMTGKGIPENNRTVLQEILEIVRTVLEKVTVLEEQAKK